MRSALRSLGSGAIACTLAACGSGSPPPPASPSQLGPSAGDAGPGPSPTPDAASADPLGERPSVDAPAPFAPPTPVVFSTPQGTAVWLLERHQVPIVSCDLTIPTGASSDPKDKAGLAYVTARMLEEGAGKRSAIDLARALDDLGARLTTDSNADASFVSITVLKSHLPEAFGLFADVVARPKLDASELKRVKELWTSELEERRKDADATARVVFRAALFGTEHPYGHPWDGTRESPKAISLADIRTAYARSWRPDTATLVCAGDVSQGEIDALVRASFGGWRRPAAPPAAPVVPQAPQGPWPRLVLVDRPDAPQAVIAALRPGIAASDPSEPVLWRVNEAIGGGFTSRLNQDLRETRGYTYGAKSRYSVSRGVGELAAWADVVVDKTGDALDALLEDLRGFAKSGLTDEEIARSRSQARSELVDVYESVESVAGHLAADASLGLGPDWEARASEKRDAATAAELNALASRFYDPKDAVLVVVGPRTVVQPMLDKRGIAFELRDEDGRPVRAK